MPVALHHLMTCSAKNDITSFSQNVNTNCKSDAEIRILKMPEEWTDGQDCHHTMVKQPEV